MSVEWPLQKAGLLFVGLLLKGVATAEPLPFAWGATAKAVAGIVWPAFDGAFLWLLRPPTQQAEEGSFQVVLGKHESETIDLN